MKRTLRIIFLVLLVLECLVTLLAAYGGMFSPFQFRALPAMMSMTFPIWVILTPVAAVAAFFVSRKMALVPVATMVLCIGPFLDFCPINFSHRATEGASRFTLLSYNTYYWGDYLDREYSEPSPTVAAILQADADIVCLQESNVPKYYKSRGISDAQLDSLQTRYPYQNFETGSLGVLSKYPIDNVSVPELPGATADLMVISINVNNNPVQIFNIHLQSIGLTREDKDLYLELTRGKADNHLRRAKTDLLSKLHIAFKNRALQASRLKELIWASGAKNIIVCGDFNDIPGCYAMRTLESVGLKNAYTTAGFGPSCTYRANRFYFHIDQVLYNKNLKPTDIQVLSHTGFSDHLPVLTSFEFQ